MTSFEQLSTTIAVITALVSLAALIFLGVQVREALKQARKTDQAQQKEWIRRRKQATIEFLTTTMALNRELKAALPYLDRTPAAAAKLIEQAKADPPIQQAIRAYLDYLENVATGVNEGVLDLGVVDRANGGRIIDIATNYASYIEARRMLLQDPWLYIELEQLAAAIRQRRNLS